MGRTSFILPMFVNAQDKTMNMSSTCVYIKNVMYLVGIFIVNEKDELVNIPGIGGLVWPEEEYDEGVADDVEGDAL